MTERQGVEIDYCPKCRGVWLDRGELDKILERSRAEADALAGAPPAAAPPAHAPGAAQPTPVGYAQPPPVSYGQPPPVAFGQHAPPPGYAPQGGYYKDGRYWQDERQYKEYKKRHKRSFFEDLFD